MRFAVVDLETTGGNPVESRIMEMGIVLMDGCEVVDTYQTLLDPGQQIPPFILILPGLPRRWFPDSRSLLALPNMSPNC